MVSEAVATTAGTGSLAAASFAAEQRLPSKRVASSGDLGWQSILVRAYEDPDETEGFTTDPTPDLLVVLNMGGAFTIESRRGGGWTQASYRPGSVGTTAPGSSARLRWRSDSPDGLRSLHMFLSSSLLRETAESLGSPGLLELLPDALLLEDPVVGAIRGALLDCVARRADPLHADSLAQALALHMVYGRLLGNRSPRTTSGPGALTAAALEPTASIAAEIAVGIFRNALERWVAPEEERPLAELIHESLDALRVFSSV